VPDDHRQGLASSTLPVSVIGHAIQQRGLQGTLVAARLKAMVQFPQNVGSMVSLPSQHDAIAPGQRRMRLLRISQAAVEDDWQLWKIVLQSPHDLRRSGGTSRFSSARAAPIPPDGHGR